MFKTARRTLNLFFLINKIAGRGPYTNRYARKGLVKLRRALCSTDLACGSLAKYTTTPQSLAVKTPHIELAESTVANNNISLHGLTIDTNTPQIPENQNRAPYVT